MPQVPFVTIPEALMHSSPLEGIHHRNGSSRPESTLYCISLPEQLLTIAYATWRAREEVAGYGIWMEPASTWEESYGSDTMERLLRSIRERGHPTAIWMLVQEEEQGISAWFLEKRE